MIINKIQESCIHLFLMNLFGHLLDIPLKYFISLKIFGVEFSYIEVCLTDQNSTLLKIES